MWWNYKEDIIKHAREFGLDPILLAAIVHVESRGNADAFRFEPKFWSRYLAKLPEYRGTNPRRVSSSYGLTQVMYVTMKEDGFVGEPEELFLPSTNLWWCCNRLKTLITWAEGYDVSPSKQLAAAIASYNGGRGGNKPTDEPLRNGHYVRKVNEAYVKFAEQFESTDLGSGDNEPQQ